MKYEELKKMAKDCEASEINLAIVLHTYLGAKKAGMDGFYAEHCQDFARSGLGMIKGMQLEKN